MNPEYYPLISGAIGGAAAAGVFKGPIETLTQIWNLTLGRFSDDAYQKYKAQQTINTEKFKKSLEKNIQEISEDNIQEPKISIVGPALEASKFYMDEDEIRDMFSKLVASSMDKSHSDYIHPSFIEMIKMLSPLDAQNLYFLYNTGDETISRININYESGGYQTIYNHIYLGNSNCQENKLIEPSIDNLIRLKLVNVSYEEYKKAENIYTKHLESQLFISYKEKVEKTIQINKQNIEKLGDTSIQQIADSNGNLLPEKVRNELKETLEKNMIKGAELQKGIIQLTALGKNFCKVCL